MNSELWRPFCGLYLATQRISSPFQQLMFTVSDTSFWCLGQGTNRLCISDNAAPLIRVSIMLSMSVSYRKQNSVPSGHALLWSAALCDTHLLKYNCVNENHITMWLTKLVTGITEWHSPVMTKRCVLDSIMSGTCATWEKCQNLQILLR